jgi:hypothetical protein
MRSVGDQHSGEPLAVVGDHTAGRHALEDCSRAVVVGLSAVSVFEAALDLELIAVRRVLLGSLHRAEEDSAVQLVAVGDRFKLEDEVARRLLRFEEASSAGKFAYKTLVTDSDVAKVSVVGIGMRSQVGVAARMFAALAAENVNIKVITTSEIKISVLIDRKYMELAVQALHDAFELEKA